MATATPTKKCKRCKGTGAIAIAQRCAAALVLSCPACAGCGTRAGGIEAHGVKGLKSTSWRKVFASADALNAWVEKQSGNVEIYGVRDVE